MMSVKTLQDLLVFVRQCRSISGDTHPEAGRLDLELEKELELVKSDQSYERKLLAEEEKIKVLFKKIVHKHLNHYLEENKGIKGGLLDKLDELLSSSSFCETERHDDVLRWGSEFISSKYIVSE